MMIKRQYDGQKYFLLKKRHQFWEPVVTLINILLIITHLKFYTDLKFYVHLQFKLYDLFTKFCHYYTTFSGTCSIFSSMIVCVSPKKNSGSSSCSSGLGFNSSNRFISSSMST